MLNSFLSFINEKKLFAPADHIILAVSGGVDSVVMTDLFHLSGFTFSIAHMNFRLRGKEADLDERFVCELAEKYGVECYVKLVDTMKLARKNKLSVQVAARQLRYRWFEELLLKTGANWLATAHHLDDQVETFLINLMRGTGIAGLHGIPVVQGKIIRPLLFTGRDEILAYADHKGLPYREDSSNRSEKYTRNRIRHKIVPHLQKINPDYRNAITGTIENVRQVETIYRQSIDAKRREIMRQEGEEIFIPTHEFFALDPIQAWAYELLAPFGFNAGNIRDIIGLKDALPGKEVLSATHRLIRDRDCLIVVPGSNSGAADRFEISARDMEKGFKGPVILDFKICDAHPGKLNTSPEEAYMDLDKLEFPLILRKWEKGDYFYPLGMKNRKKLSDFFIDLKFTKPEKENQWLLCSGENIIWVPGHRLDDRVKVDAASQKILKILFRKTSK